jgi:hypothetical protein
MVVLVAPHRPRRTTLEPAGQQRDAQRQQSGQHREGGVQARHQRPVRRPAAGQVADHQAGAEEHQQLANAVVQPLVRVVRAMESA